MTLTVTGVVAILIGSVFALGLLLVVWRRRALLDRGPTGRIISYALAFALALTIIVLVTMIEALVRVLMS
jgi:ABC-type methionine transport system permease subunit